jgi:hypothetical protein
MLPMQLLIEPCGLVGNLEEYDVAEGRSGVERCHWC